LKDLLAQHKSTATLSYDWTDFQPGGVGKLHGSPLVLLGENGKNKYLLLCLVAQVVGCSIKKKKSAY
jgi:hypothetical protein